MLLLIWIVAALLALSRGDAMPIAIFILVFGISYFIRERQRGKQVWKEGRKR